MQDSIKLSAAVHELAWLQKKNCDENNTVVATRTVIIIASEEVVIRLIRTKCVPILLYGLEALPLNKSQLASLDFVVNRFFVKLFKTTDMQVVKMCREHFDFVLPNVRLDRRRRSFVGSPVTNDLIKFIFA